MHDSSSKIGIYSDFLDEDSHYTLLPPTWVAKYMDLSRWFVIKQSPICLQSQFHVSVKYTVTCSNIHGNLCAFEPIT